MKDDLRFIITRLSPQLFNNINLEHLESTGLHNNVFVSTDINTIEDTPSHLKLYKLIQLLKKKPDEQFDWFVRYMDGQGHHALAKEMDDAKKGTKIVLLNKRT